MRASRRRFHRALAFFLLLAASSWRALAGEGPASFPDPLDLSYYLPPSPERDPEVPAPRSSLGFEVGERHARHDQIVAYMNRLAEISGRVTVEVYGESHEKRPLLLVAISSPENIERLESIRDAHRARALGTRSRDESLPAVVWLGYSVHGNEASGANASLLVAYHLAASRNAGIEAMLDGLVVLIDPCINPDGYSRFVLWANMHRGRRLVADPSHREHVEGWPNGRTNHYWFDLNRDWLLLVHPESRARLEAFHRWRPTVLGDFHEMGSDATYFFQPGVASRQNPRTPQRNLELTRRIARHHARALDALGSLYFTGEVFDDFYYGKGSTYPDVNGSVGILFEQASARGHVREGDPGPLSFPFAIRNQLATSLSTLRAVVADRSDLLAYQGEFHARALEESAADPVRAYVFGDPEDRARTWHMVDLLRRHRIEVHEIDEAVVDREGTFAPGRAFLVETAQPQYRLVKALFERRTAFEDTTFYDVSSWTLPLAYAMPVVELAREDAVESLRGARVVDPPFPRGEAPYLAAPYAWIFEWSEYYAPRALYRLLDAGVRARVATRPFEVAEEDLGEETGEERAGREFRRGAIVVAAGVQDLEEDALREIFRAIVTEDGVDVRATRTGLVAGGVDLGSPSLKPLERPRPALLVGRGVSAYEAGEAWHLLDHRFGIETSLIDLGMLSRARLERYTHLILVHGSYSSLGEKDWDRIRRWVRRGGVVIATRGGAEKASRALLERDGEEVGSEKEGEEETAGASATRGEPGAGDPAALLRYGDFRRERDRRRISGAIFEVALDLTHPLAYGYSSDRLPVFRRGRSVMPLDPDPYANPARYTDAPLLSGYASEENRKRIAGTASVIANRLGEGVVIRMIDNPSFRGFFLGTTKLFLNALFFGGLIEDTNLAE